MKVKPLTLTDAYQDANLPVVRRRLSHGGIRLAMMRSEAFPVRADPC